MSLVYLGSKDHDDVITPAAGVDDWGIDTLERQVRGSPAWFRQYHPKRGDVYESFFLQSWKPITDRIFPGYSLSYKGCPSGLPDPLIVNTQCEICSNIPADNLSVTVASTGKVIVSAVKELKYIAPQTIYRYITDKEPDGPKYNTVRGSLLQLVSSVVFVTFDDGTSQVLTGNIPGAVTTALHVNPEIFVIGPTAARVFGTPYWECEDQVSLRYPVS